MSVPSRPGCKRHPAALAGWRCVKCGALLCPECVEARRMHTVDLLACRACGDRAEPLLVHRSQRVPLEERLRTAWTYARSSRFLALVLGAGTVLTGLTFFTQVTLIVVRMIPAALLLGVYAICFFGILMGTARGERDVPPLEYSDLFSDWLLPAFRGAVGTSVAWLPPLLYLAYFGGWDVAAYRERLLNDPMFYMTGAFHALPWELVRGDPVAWLLGLVCFASLPMSLLLSASSAHPLDMINPIRGLHAIQRMGRDYALTVGALAVLALTLGASHLLAAGLRAIDLGILTRWIAQLVELPVFFLGAHVLGLLLYTRGDALGYGADSDYLQPLLLDSTPSTTLRVDGLGLPDAVSEAEVHAVETRLAELTEATQARDVPRALALYAAADVLPRTRITPAVHLFVGQAAATQGDHALAVRALETAADVAPDDVLAPRALVLLARVLGERMNEPGRAQQVYRYIVERYPDTDASRFAQARLPPTN
ncbi:hypothetical protein [Archangium primigenium]|uniref:hypothetical protein n=1 Tax=[Archangium] primigenium TaxID=2792470 RepID=UPI0019591A48|nr:hypothetical protein [Archangium primigenium]MBM7114836.1 hypothetical protein [Archangium primigenium]